MSQITTLTGFGISPEHAHYAHFNVLIQGFEDVYPGWNREMLRSTRQFAGSSSFVTQIGGFGPSTLTLRLEFLTDRDWERFALKEGTLQTLVLLAGYTRMPGITRTHLGMDYIQYPETLLLDINNVNEIIGGGAECTATFQRAHDPRNGGES